MAKLTQGLQVEIAKLVNAGVPLGVAARTKGVGRRTVYDWMQKGAEQEVGKYRSFHDAIREAQAAYATALQLFITKEAQGNWRAAAWWLERMQPEYAKNTHSKVELTGKGGGPVQTEELPALTPEKADQIRRAVLYGDEDDHD